MKITPNMVARVEESIASTSKSLHPFMWCDDGCGAEPWYYEFHMEWVEAWNLSGRKEDAVTFLRAWVKVH